jgi:hypothetical protein
MNRPNWDGTGGTGAALRHFQEMRTQGKFYPLAGQLNLIIAFTCNPILNLLCFVCVCVCVCSQTGHDYTARSRRIQLRRR